MWSIIHHPILLLNCLMISTAFRTSLRSVHHRGNTAFFRRSAFYRPTVRSPSHLFSTTTADKTTDNNGQTYQIKSTSYQDTKYDVTNKANGLTGSYDPASFEGKVYEWWEKAGCFDPDCKPPSSGEKAEPYVLPMPPPNVTGRLHMGHAIFVALQDVLARFHRMRGKEVLWTPGTDHAGIATQLQVSPCILKLYIWAIVYSPIARACQYFFFPLQNLNLSDIHILIRWRN